MKVFQSNVQSLSDVKIREAFSLFLKRDEAYKRMFLQKEYNNPYSGYSYLGQKDSLNQYEGDQLFSFVLSDHTEVNSLPKEFQEFYKTQWEGIKQQMELFQLNMLDALNLPNLAPFILHKGGYMLSCNYYPAQSNTTQQESKPEEERLSKHIDASFLSTFPFGIEEGLQYQNEEGETIEVGKRDKIIAFPGFLMDLLSEGKMPALEHQVAQAKDNAERFTFSLFSIPRPGAKLKIDNEFYSAEEYYNKYLSLF